MNLTEKRNNVIHLLQKNYRTISCEIVHCNVILTSINIELQNEKKYKVVNALLKNRAFYEEKLEHLINLKNMMETDEFFSRHSGDSP